MNPALIIDPLFIAGKPYRCSLCSNDKTDMFILTHFSSMFHFIHSECKCQKIKGFLTFSQGTEMRHWAKTGKKSLSVIFAEQLMKPRALITYIKNCDPFVFLPRFAIESKNGRS